MPSLQSLINSNNLDDETDDEIEINGVDIMVQIDDSPKCAIVKLKPNDNLSNIRDSLHS